MSNTAKRGFGSMDPKRQREIASQGGTRAHELGVAHEFTCEEAQRAGRIGGQRTQAMKAAKLAEAKAKAETASETPGE